MVTDEVDSFACAVKSMSSVWLAEARHVLGIKGENRRSISQRQ